VNHGRTHARTHARTAARTDGRTTRKHTAYAGAYRRRRLKERHADGTVPPCGVSKSMVSLSVPALPWFSTRTPALIVEYGHKSSTAPSTDDPTCRRRRCSGKILRGGQGFAGGPTRMSVDLTSSGLSARQNWICITISSGEYLQTAAAAEIISTS